MSHLLSVPEDDIASSVEKQKRDFDALRFSLKDAKKKLLQQIVSSVPKEQRNILLFVEETNADLIREAVNSLTETHRGFCGIFYHGAKTDQKTPKTEAEEYSYIIGSRQENPDVREINAKLKEAFGAKGGGKPQMVQGHVCASHNEILNLFSENEMGLS